MADRRMFSKTIINSGRFLQMGPSARLLYYDLGMAADDDGVVEAFSVMRMTGASEDDLKILYAKGFIKIIDNDAMIAVITDWKVNNFIRADRYHPSRYHDLLVKIQDLNELPKMQEIAIDNQPTTDGIPSDNQVTTNGQPNDANRYTEVRLGKERLVEDRVSEGQESINSPSTAFKPEQESLPSTHTEAKKAKDGSARVSGVTYSDDPELDDAIKHFIGHRKVMKRQMSRHAVDLFIKRLNKIAPDDNLRQIELINTAILNGWLDVYPESDILKRQRQNTQSDPLTQFMRERGVGPFNNDQTGI